MSTLIDAPTRPLDRHLSLIQVGGNNSRISDQAGVRPLLRSQHGWDHGWYHRVRTHALSDRSERRECERRSNHLLGGLYVLIELSLRSHCCRNEWVTGGRDTWWHRRERMNTSVIDGHRGRRVWLCRGQYVLWGCCQMRTGNLRTKVAATRVAEQGAATAEGVVVAVVGGGGTFWPLTNVALIKQ